MLGTDLFQAYEQGGGGPNHNNNHQHMDFDTPSESVPNVSSSSSHPSTSAQNQQQPSISIQEPIYDPTTTYKEAHMQQQLANLQAQLYSQEKQKNKNDTSVFDRFVSKKKDVLKLITMSLTVLLGISLHYVVTDLIRNYLANNDFTANQEFTTRLSYPLTVIMLIWTLKVFNR